MAARADLRFLDQRYGCVVELQLLPELNRCGLARWWRLHCIMWQLLTEGYAVIKDSSFSSTSSLNRMSPNPDMLSL